MSWFPWSDSIKNRACRYLLQRYLGNFLEKLTLDQLSVDIYNGQGFIQQVSLDVAALNDTLEGNRIPLEIVEGYIGKVTVQIPWSSLTSGNTSVEVSGLEITLRPKPKKESYEMDIEGMFSSMTSSMKLAEECLREETNNGDRQQTSNFEGLEKFAQMIESVLMRVKISFTKTVFRLEHVSKSSGHGSALEIQIQRIDFFDNQAMEMKSSESENFEPAAFALKNLKICGVIMFCEEMSPRPPKGIQKSVYVSTNEKFQRRCDSISDEVDLSLPANLSILSDQPSVTEQPRADGLLIKFAECQGKQEIKIHVKQNADAKGPKLDIKCQFAIMMMMLSPAQVHLILHVIHGFDFTGETKRRSSNAIFRRNRPMRAADYHLVEEQLQSDLSECTEDIDETASNKSAASSPQDIKSAQTNFYKHGSNFAGRSPFQANPLKNAGDCTAAADSLHFRFSCSHFSMICLESNPLPVRGDGIEPGQSSQDVLCGIIGRYFSGASGEICKGGLLPEVRRRLSQLLAINHISFLAKPISFRGWGNDALSTIDIDIGSMEVVESLFPPGNATPKQLPGPTKILTFNDDEVDLSKSSMMDSIGAGSPAFQLKYRQLPQKASYLLRGSQERQISVVVKLRRFSSEVDPTIVERVQDFVQLPAYLSNTASANPDEDILAEASTNKIDLKIVSSECSIAFWFPVAGRPEVGKRTTAFPWWLQRLHQEVIVLQVEDAEFHTLFDANFDLSCRQINGYLKEANDNSEGFHFIKVSSDVEGDDRFNLPRLDMHFSPAIDSTQGGLEEPYSPSPELESMSDTCHFSKSEPSPFTSKKFLYDNEEKILVGDVKEMNDFQTYAVSNSRSHLRLQLPCVVAFLPSKKFFERLYNRVCNDLLLWEPQLGSSSTKIATFSSNCPGRLDVASQLGVASSLFCSTANEGDADVDEKEEFYSINTQPSFSEVKVPRGRGQTALCVTINIQNGWLHAVTDGKITDEKVDDDKAEQQKVGHQAVPPSLLHGQACLHVQDLVFFSAVKYSKDPNLGYFCLTAKQATLFHAGSVEETPTSLSSLGCQPPPHLFRTIYRSGAGVKTKCDGPDGRDEGCAMLSLAVEMNLKPLKNTKEIKVAVDMKGATLRYLMCANYLSWFTQLLDLLDVVDYPIMGYTMPRIITQLYVNLSDCAVDYRPKYLPLQAVLTADTFSISSNIVAEAKTSLLRFILEDASLFLSNKCKAKEVDLRQNYISVINLNLFELSLRSTDGRNPRHPITDLQITNSRMSIRTCSDSCQALANLIRYLASKGDITEDLSQRSHPMTPVSRSSSSGDVSDSARNQVHEMMADAMEPADEKRLQDEFVDNRTVFAPGWGEQVNEDLYPASSMIVQPPPSLCTTPPTESSFFRKANEIAAPLQVEASPPVLGSHEFLSDHLHDSTPSVSSSNAFAIRDTQGDLHCAVDESSDEFDLDESVHSVNLSNSPSHNVVYQHRPLRQEGSIANSIVSSLMSDSHLRDDPAHDLAGGSVDTCSDDEDFCVVNAPGLGIAPRDGEPSVKVLSSAPVKIDENYFKAPIVRLDQLKSPAHFPEPVYRYTLREMTLTWHLYGGSDLSSAPVPFTSSPRSQHRALRMKQKSGEVDWKERGGPGRDVETLMELHLSKIRMQYEQFPEASPYIARPILLIHNIEVLDKLSSSKLNKFLHLYSSGKIPRQSHANMILMKALLEKAEPVGSAQTECSIIVTLQPLRLNIDQDALFFLRSFFTAVSESPAKSFGEKRLCSPVMSIETDEKVNDTSLSKNELLSFDEFSGETKENPVEPVEERASVFYKSFIFSANTPIKLDYQGKRLDMENGTLEGLLLGLARLNCSELKLKKIECKHGFLGLDKLLISVAKEWLDDIRNNQVRSILSGVGPMHSFVQLAQGICDLFALPFEQYQRDGRIMRGVQRGACSFTTSTATATLELASGCLQTLQWVAEFGHDIVAPGPQGSQQKTFRRKRLLPPADLREGIATACSVVKEGIRGTAQNIIKVAQQGHEQKGLAGAVGGVLRQLPPTALQPIMLATEASSNVLDGMRNQLRPDLRKEDQEKWKEED